MNIGEMLKEAEELREIEAVLNSCVREMEELAEEVGSQAWYIEQRVERERARRALNGVEPLPHDAPAKLRREVAARRAAIAYAFETAQEDLEKKGKQA